MNILLINHYAGSTQHGMEFRPFYLAREWVRSGHKVQIVAAAYSHIRPKQPVLDGAMLDEKIEGIQYRWFRTPRYSGNSYRRVLNMLSFLWKLWRNTQQLAIEFQPHVVIASSTYPMDIWPAMRIAKIAQAKLIFEVHDLWPLSPIELGNMSRLHPFIVWVQLAEDYAYKHAHKVVSMLPNAREYMMSRGMTPEKFVYIPNGVDVQEWISPAALPTEVAAHLDQIVSVGLPIVAYIGTHGLANALDILLDAAHALQGKAQLLLVGTGPERERLLSRVKKEGLTNVVMLPSIPKQSIPMLLTLVDIVYLGWHPNPLYRFGISPNKLMDYMMAAKPVIHSVDAGNDPVAEAGCGITVPPGDAAAVANAVLKLIALSPRERQEMGKSGKRFILAKHTYSVLAKQFLDSIFVGQTNR